MLANNDIRLTAKGNNVALWQIAEVLKISEPTMTRKMRKELPQQEKDKILGIIKELAE